MLTLTISTGLQTTADVAPDKNPNARLTENVCDPERFHKTDKKFYDYSTNNMFGNQNWPVLSRTVPSTPNEPLLRQNLM